MCIILYNIWKNNANTYACKTGNYLFIYIFTDGFIIKIDLKSVALHTSVDSFKNKTKTLINECNYKDVPVILQQYASCESKNSC